MTEEQPTQDFAAAEASIEDDDVLAIAPEVAFVVPAPAYESIATDDEIAVAALAPHASSPSLDLSPALAAIAALGGRIEALGQAFDREIRAEATREKIVDRLHAELQEYKQGLVLSLLKPVFLDLIQLHDDVGKMAAAGGSGADGESSRPSLAANVQEGIADILYRQGVEPFTKEGEDFDARRQRAIQTIPTDDPALARKIAGRLRPGFATGEKVIRPEVVSVFAFRNA